ncbi:MAG TPA: hypothetical protein VFQ61_34630 [Polyangiaceae bacterium]|nr:hypothetical protein [Polyangiaceae bacterium]
MIGSFLRVIRRIMQSIIPQDVRIEQVLTALQHAYSVAGPIGQLELRSAILEISSRVWAMFEQCASHETEADTVMASECLLIQEQLCQSVGALRAPARHSLSASGTRGRQSVGSLRAPELAPSTGVPGDSLDEATRAKVVGQVIKIVDNILSDRRLTDISALA